MWSYNNQLVMKTEIILKMKRSTNNKAVIVTKLLFWVLLWAAEVLFQYNFNTNNMNKKYNLLSNKNKQFCIKHYKRWTTF